MDRRDAVRWLAATVGLTCLDGMAADEIFVFGRHVHAQAADAALHGAAQLRALDAHANRTVIAAAERIIPRSDTPGATDAEVHVFIDRMLADWHTPAERERVLDGLRALDLRSRARCARDFADCAEADQVAVLTAFDDEVTALRATPAAARPDTVVNPNDHWFAMLKDLTALGYFTSEVALRQTLREYPLPGRYDGCAPYQPRVRTGAPS